MKQVVKDITILMTWIAVLFICSWLLVWVTSDIRNAALIDDCNTKLIKQGNNILVKQIISAHDGTVLFSSNKTNKHALLSSIITTSGTSLNLIILDASNRIDDLYPIDSSSRIINQRTDPKVIHFNVRTLLSNAVLKEKRSKQ
ncbi:hypothetical protein [Gracilinema caldarium]|uniref:Uncharacterized protein n=1 Tax=Gracilinema caldarium (strain ATCC 51460 / DSM 7334 / H1) TaxID=744872 RepID=F8F1U1_GRAC1|nr:hypothetical protein [Gracilinema caldarium]AEJ19425.1 hypothetical protein Spica_1279 [Gracilinema caldarium DSM 7334]